MTPSFHIFLKLTAINVAGGEPRPATKLLYQHLSKKAGKLDLKYYIHVDRLWESTLEDVRFSFRRICRAPSPISRSPARRQRRRRRR